MNLKTADSRTNIFQILYFCFFLLLPFIYADKLVDPVLIPRQIFLTLFVFIAGGFSCYWVYKKKIIADFSFLRLLLPLLLLAFLITTVLSFFQAIAVVESVYVFSKLVIEILFYVITTWLFIQKRLNTETISKAVIVFSGIVTVIAIYQLFTFLFSEYGLLRRIEHISSTIANKNLLSSVLFLTLPFLVNAIALSKPWKIASAVLLFLILTLFWTVQTKAVVVATFIFLLVFIFFFFRHRKTITDKLFVNVILLEIILAVILATVITTQNKKEFVRLTDTNSTFQRLSLWNNSVQMAKDHLLFGVGAGNWQVDFPKYGLNKFDVKRVKDGLTTFQRPHNDFLWVLCEQGLPGIIVYVSIFIIALFYLYRLLQGSERFEDRWLYVSLFAAITGYIVIAFVDFPLERIEHQVFLCLMFSIITAGYYNRFSIPKASKRTVISLSVLMIMLIVPALFSFLVSMNRYTGEYHTRKLYNAQQAENWLQMASESEKAMNSFYVMDPTSAPIEWYKGVALFSEGDMNDTKASFEKAYTIHPYNIHVLNNLASCYEKLGDHAKAEEFYLKAVAISPGFEETMLNLSAVYYNTKQYEKAFEMIDKCDTASADLKYKTFLPVILKSWIGVQISKQHDLNSINKLTDLQNSGDKIIQIYLDSKRKKGNFAQYLLNDANR